MIDFKLSWCDPAVEKEDMWLKSDNTWKDKKQGGTGDQKALRKDNHLNKYMM